MTHKLERGQYWIPSNAEKTRVIDNVEEAIDLVEWHWYGKQSEKSSRIATFNTWVSRTKATIRG